MEERESLREGGFPRPDFDAWNACGTDAKESVVRDQGDGWTCTKCWATDGGD